MKEFEIIIENGKANIRSPYNPDFVKRVKALGGRWSAANRTWQVREEAIEAAREAMLETYGRCDREPTATVTVVVKTTRVLVGDRKPIYLFGKLIASASGRDSGANVGDSVAFTEGRPTSGGSRANWTTIVPSESTIEIYNVAADYAKQEIAKLDARDPYTATIKTVPQIDRDAVLVERERLMARVAEIDALLSEG